MAQTRASRPLTMIYAALLIAACMGSLLPPVAHAYSSSSSSSVGDVLISTPPLCSAFRDHCDFNTSTASCIFTRSTSLSCDGTDTDAKCWWEVAGDLVVSANTTIQIIGANCFLGVTVGKMLVLQPNASIHAAGISVDASFVRLEPGASIVANFIGAGLFPANESVGASHGGSGGRRLHLNDTTGEQQQRLGAFFDVRNANLSASRAWDLEVLWKLALLTTDTNTTNTNADYAARMLTGSGSALASTTAVAGGGRIRLAASRDIVLMPGARIAADGVDANVGDQLVGGGSGGSVFVSANALSLTNATVGARGGAAACRPHVRSVDDCAPGGGGGRVHIAYVSSQLADDAVDVHGGELLSVDADDTDDTDDADRVDRLVAPAEQQALSGASGTFLRVTKAKGTEDAVLLVSGGRHRSALVGAATIVDVADTDRRIGHLVVRDGAVLATTGLVLLHGDLSLKNHSSLVDARAFSSVHRRPHRLEIIARDVVVELNASVLLAGDADAMLASESFTLDASAVVRFANQHVMVSSVRSLRLQGVVDASTSTASRLTLVSGQDLWLSGTVSVGALAVHADAVLTVAASTPTSTVQLEASRHPAADARFPPCDPKTVVATVGATDKFSSAADRFAVAAAAANFTMLLQAAESITVGTNRTDAVDVQLVASAVLLCAATEIDVDTSAIVSSSGRGEQSNQGPGAGACVKSVGGGGGYGGRGADSSAVDAVGDFATGGLGYGTHGAAGVGLLGAGGGCVDGGAGGGVVMLGARGVELDGAIHCDGEGARQSSGGGAGGFLGLTVTEFLRGAGKISAVGGGAQCLPASTTTANASTIVSMLVDGGATPPSTASTPSRVCGGGGGGGRLQLRGCEFGDVDACTSGFEGNYTVSGGATSVNTVPEPSPSTPSSSSTPPSTPLSTPVVETVITSGASGSFVGFPCLPGSGGLFCRLCGPGSFKAESNSEECSVCSNAPPNSHYTGSGGASPQCLWACDPGYSGSQCVSPIQQLLDACGGLLGFALVLFGIVLFLTLLGYACRSRKEPGRPSVHTRGHRAGGHSSASTLSERQHLLSAAIVSTQRSRLVRWLYWPRVGYPKLVERDLPEHMARIYLSGSHDRESPLKLRLTVPTSLQPVLYDDEFRLLAARINAVLAWPEPPYIGSLGEVIYRLTQLLCYPLASTVLAYRRHLRINALKRIIARYNHACMKGPRARGLLNALKLGYAGDYSLVYLELLYKESSQSTCVPTTKTIGKPTLPLVLLFAGRGSYECPFYLDPSDLLVRSVPQCPQLTAFIDEPWIEFVAELNELLRVVSRHEARLVETLQPVAQFLEKKMAGDGRKLGGLEIYLGRFYVGDDMDDEFKLGLLLTAEGGTATTNNAYNYYGPGAATATMLPATATAASSTRPSTYGYGATYQAPSAHTLDAYDTHDALLLVDPVAGGWSQQPPSSASNHTHSGSSTSAAPSRAYVRRGSVSTSGPPLAHKSTVSSIRDEALRLRSNTSGSVENLVGGVARLSDLDSPDLFVGGGHSFRNRRRWQTFYEGWLGPVDASLPVPGVLISADELEDRLADRTRQQRVEATLRRMLLPTNVPCSKFLGAAWMLSAALLSLLMVDLAITFAMVVNLRCVTNGKVDKECSATILMPVLLLPPLTLLLAPILGIVSLAIASNAFSRKYATWNALSMVNVAVAVLTCLTQSSRLVAPWFTAPLPLLPVIAMLVKAGAAYVIERYIAFQETTRRRRGWRGLMKRRFSDASIPPESPYSSPVSSDSASNTLTVFR